MAINKIVYFMHSDFLVEENRPLVSAKIEAWTHGPVYRELYQEFKLWGEGGILSRAHKVDAVTGDLVLARVNLEDEEQAYLNVLIDRYIKLTASQLRALSHVEGGPWHKVWGHEGKSNPGMRISDDLIKAYHSPGVTQ